MRINWIKKVGNKAAHNAFTDLCEFKQYLYCCFREAKNHVSRDGKIKIVTLDLHANKKFESLICLPNADLRDPKLSLTPEGNLLLIAYARVTNPITKKSYSKNICWISQTGKSWSANTEFANRGWWLWRLTWHHQQAFGLAYNRRANAIHLYKGDPRRSFHLHKKNVLSLAKHNKGYPNESDLLFVENTAYALVRRDADSYSAQLGTSHFPYTQWKWIDLKAYIGGPAMVHIKKNLALVAGRIVQDRKLVTGLLSLDLLSGRLTLLTVLPSAGDNSYPGLVLRKQILYVSYYSSHENDKTCVYLAKIDIAKLFKS